MKGLGILWTCLLCTIACAQAFVPANLSPLAEQPFLFPDVPPMVGPRAKEKVSSLQSPVSSQVVVPGTNVTLEVVAPDPRGNAFNFYWTTDDVAYFYLGTSADGTITVSNQVGTNYYSATAVDTNGAYLESDFSGDLQVPDRVFVPATNFVVSWGSVRNVTLQESGSLQSTVSSPQSGWFTLTNITGSNAIVPNEWLACDAIRAVTTDQPPVTLQIAPQ